MPPVSADPPAVKVVDVLQKDVPTFQEWVATTDGLVNATIRAEVQGYLLKQNYQEGDLVKKGQLLFEIDPRPFEAALNQAEAVLKQAAAASEQAAAEVTRNEAQLYIAETNLARVKPLAEENAISQKDLDDAVGTERAARAAVIASKASVNVAQAAIGVARAALEKAKLDLGFTKIVSPIEGIAGIARAQVGDLVGPAQTGELATVSTVNPMKVYYSVSEETYVKYMKRFGTEAAAVKGEEGTEHELFLADGAVYPHKGTFYAIDRQVDNRTGTIRMELLFPNPDNLLRPGQFGKVRRVEEKKGALLVPQLSVAELQGTYQVAVVGPSNTVEMRSVKPGERIGAWWVIDEGLKPNERVVAEGIQKVKQGMTINPQPMHEPAPPLTQPETIAPQTKAAEPAEAGNT